MRALLALAAYAALTVSAFAQNGLREITATETISLRIGQTRVFAADRTIATIENTSIEVAKTTPVLSDQQFFIEGVGPGETLITVGYKDGTFYRMNVNVGGRTVRIYGNERKAKTAAYYFCTSAECTKQKPDVDKRAPSSESIAVTGRDEDGNIVTTTKTY